MIVSTHVTTKVSNSNKAYWRARGYVFAEPDVRNGVIPTIRVSVRDLEENSNVRVECYCERCETFYENRINRNIQYCRSCDASMRASGNTFASVNKGKRNLKQTGDSHPRWNPDKTPFEEYKSKVLSAINRQDFTKLENYELLSDTTKYRRAYKIHIKEGFEQGIPPEQIGDVSNFVVMTTEERKKHRQGKLFGEKHFRWNPDKTSFKAYKKEVSRITEAQELSLLPDSDKPRTQCGVTGGYQLDHIFTVADGFRLGVDPQIVGNIANLRFIPWEDNHRKRDTSSITLDDLLQKIEKSSS